MSLNIEGNLTIEGVVDIEPIVKPIFGPAAVANFDLEMDNSYHLYLRGDPTKVDFYNNDARYHPALHSSEGRI